MSKFKDSFLGEGGNVGEFIVYDILIPAFRNTVATWVLGYRDVLGRGSNRGGYNDRVIVRDRGDPYVSYNDVSRDRGRGRDDRRLRQK